MKITVSQLRKVVWEILKQEAQKTDPLVQLIKESGQSGWNSQPIDKNNMIRLVVDTLKDHATPHEIEDRYSNYTAISEFAFKEVAADIIKLFDGTKLQEVEINTTTSAADADASIDTTGASDAANKISAEQDPVVKNLQSQIDHLNDLLRQPLEQKAKLDKKIGDLNNQKLQKQRKLDDIKGGIGGIGVKQ